MTRDELAARTRRFGVDALRFCAGLPHTEAHRVISRQLMRCATSVGANYRAACRARSRNEFLAKLGIVEEEVDESVYWLDVLLEFDPNMDGDRLAALRREAAELTAIVVSSIRTARSNRT